MQRTFVLFVFLAASLQWCVGQTNNIPLAIGDWSVPVSDADGFKLRGRLRVEDTKEISRVREVWVYLELQYLADGLKEPIEICVNPNTDLAFELRDGHDQIVNPVGVASFNGPWRLQFTTALIPDSTLKLPVGWMYGNHGDPRLILTPMGGGPWPMPRGAASDYFLCAVFSPPGDKQSPLNYHLWKGFLTLPKLKMPVDKIRDILGLDE